MKKYVGITVGPIFDTISDATSPAALWFASAFFSDITRRICMYITAEGSGQILSPYFDEEDKSGLKDGVGKYHDRIFFSADREEADLKSGLDNMIARVKEETADNFGEFFFTRTGESRDAVKAFLQSYLQIHYIILDREQIGDSNCILVISPYLDALELMKTFPVSDRDNPFRRLMAGIEEAGNVLIKESLLYQSVDKDRNPLKDPEGKIWNIEEIARGKRAELLSDDKYLNYYAVVSADADGMGAFLKDIWQDKTRLFSERCLSYDKKAAQMIHAYGGMTIYAGGDDLLFLAPVMNGEKTIFNLCREIAELFEEIIRGDGGEFAGNPIPTVSFGVSVQYYKFPLYEALNRSREYLRTAKGFVAHNDCSRGQKPQKNCMYFGLEKHSGQSADILIGNEAVEIYDDLLKEMLAKGTARDGVDEQTVKSLGTSLDRFRHIIYVMDRNYEKQVLGKPFWDNLFDNEAQKSGAEFRKYVEEWYYTHLVDEKCRIVSLTGAKEKGAESQRFDSLLSALRIGKFFLEKKEEGGEW